MIRVILTMMLVITLLARGGSPHIVVEYDEKAEQPKYVIYNVQPTSPEKTVSRGSFKLDPSVSTETAHPDDYKYSGYDRGHLAPFSEFHADIVGAKASMLMSNISPMLPSFNRSIWARIDRFIKGMAIAHHTTLTVITGPVFIRSGPEQSINGVMIPDMFYKVVYKGNTLEYAFLVPHTGIRTDNILNYGVDVEYINVVADINIDIIFQTYKEENDERD